MQKKQLTSLTNKNMTKARQKWKTSLVHAVSARFYKKVGARLLETRQHVMKMWISNVFSLSIIKAINLNWIVLLISCFCLFYQKMPSQTQSKGTVKPKKIKLYFKSKNKGGFFRVKMWPENRKHRGEMLVFCSWHWPMDQGLWENGLSTGLFFLRNQDMCYLCKGDGDPFGFGSGRIIPKVLQNLFAIRLVQSLQWWDILLGEKGLCFRYCRISTQSRLMQWWNMPWGRGIMCSRDRKIPYQSSHIIPSMIPPQRNEERSN